MRINPDIHWMAIGDDLVDAFVRTRRDRDPGKKQSF